ncbi:1984_t:CDS:2 [Funneliformis mosseae]|uniref:1984_t:CDS:1 n=1 Tax=Funneliformis mosseae TaxID=27381 RepID=A0A9N9DPU6_FUNMO|nr:1984_t:CDS:2 [Funneliformis mosseae]
MPFGRELSDSLVNTRHTCYSALIAPFLKFFNLSRRDLTYGRTSLPYSATEKIIRSPPYLSSDHILPFPFNNDQDSFIYYQVWSLPTAKVQRNVDLLFIHGLNDYGGRFSENCIPILEAGFRIISPDLPSFGRSSGLHAYVTEWQDFIKATKLVVDNVKELDAKENRQRKLIISGGSLGGLIAMAYSIKYPNTFDALMLQCPLIHVAGQSRPSKFAEIIAKVIVNTPLGRLPIVSAHRGKSSSDPKVLENFLSDPQTYHGNLRVSTGLTLLDATEWIQSNLGQVRKSFLVQHGLNDRVTLCDGTRDLFAQAQTPEDQKTMILYEQCEHDMWRDPFAGERTMNDFINWLIQMDENLK